MLGHWQTAPLWLRASWLTILFGFFLCTVLFFHHSMVQKRHQGQIYHQHLAHLCLIWAILVLPFWLILDATIPPAISADGILLAALTFAGIRTIFRLQEALPTKPFRNLALIAQAALSLDAWLWQGPGSGGFLWIGFAAYAHWVLVKQDINQSIESELITNRLKATKKQLERVIEATKELGLISRASDAVMTGAIHILNGVQGIDDHETIFYIRKAQSDSFDKYCYLRRQSPFAIRPIDVVDQARIEKTFTRRIWGKGSYIFQNQLIVPITSKDDILAILVLNLDGKTKLTPEDKSFCSGIASAAAMSLQASQLFELHKDIEIASAIQSSLLPSHSRIQGVAIVPHYQPAEHAGGDWFDYHYDESGERVFICLGDVTGHGIASALVTAAISGAVRAHLSYTSGQNAPSREVLQDLASLANTVIRGTSSHVSYYMTVCFIAIDLKSRTLTYLNGAHCPIYLKSPTASCWISQPGPTLGVQDRPKFPIRTKQLQKDDVLFMYTDGLTENRGPGKQRLTMGRLKRTIDKAAQDPQSVLDAVLAESESVLQDHPLEDDCSFLVIQFQGIQENSHLAA